MTKFILIGGYPSVAPDGGQQLVHDMVESLSQPTRILDVLFARQPETWPDAYKKDQQFFEQFLRSEQFELVQANPDEFSDQVSTADVVYFRGGATPLLQSVLAKQPNWMKDLQNKTIAGTSAGAYILGSYYHEMDPSGIGQGYGFVAYKPMAHWGAPAYGTPEEWTRAEQELKNHGNQDPILKLREGEYRVFTIEN